MNSFIYYLEHRTDESCLDSEMWNFGASLDHKNEKKKMYLEYLQ